MRLAAITSQPTLVLPVACLIRPTANAQGRHETSDRDAACLHPQRQPNGNAIQTHDQPEVCRAKYPDLGTPSSWRAMSFSSLKAEDARRIRSGDCCSALLHGSVRTDPIKP